MDWNRLEAAQIRQRLALLPVSAAAECSDECRRLYRAAGVLAPLIRVDQTWRLLFIRRSRFEGDRHSGQVAFAGGKREAGDANIRETALREAEEELGIDRRSLQMLGELPPYHSSTGFCITAQVAQLDWPLRLRPQPREVARVFSLPLDWLADGGNWRRELIRRDNGSRAEVIRYREYDGECLWGATAGMVQQLLQALSGPGARESRVAQK